MDTVNRRTFRPLVYALVAVQLLLSVASAWAAEVSAQAPAIQSMPCDDMNMQSDVHHSKQCPCCPDGVAGTMDCQSACAGGVAVISVARYFVPNSAAVPTVEPLPVYFHPLAEPPLKPPPIA